MLLPDCGVLVPDLLLSGVAIEVAVLVAVDSFSTSIFPSDVREDDLLFLSERSSSSPSESVYVATPGIFEKFKFILISEPNHRNDG